MPEQQNIEYKQSWRDEYFKWICGFANAQGGKIFIGIDDAGKIVGLEDYKRLLEDIPNKAVSYLGIVVDVNLHKKGSKHYIEIIVQPNSVPISYHGVYYYRSGSTKQELRGAALQEFLLRKIGKTWDDLVVSNATIKDLNLSAIKSFVKLGIENERLPKGIDKDSTDGLLENLRLVEKGKPKNATLLLFGKAPLKYFVTATFKIGRFVTNDDLKFQDIIEGNILEMADKVMEILKAKYLTAPISYKGLRRIEQLEYPESALREAILNAIVHKDYTDSTIQLSVYDDKLILWNPGTLPLEISIDKLKKKHPSRPRNKHIADIFFKAGYIEAWGRGIEKILTACRQAGLPEPLFEELNGGVQITFLKDRYTEEYLQNLNLNERQIKAVFYVKKRKSITNAKYQELAKVSKATATRDLKDLLERKIFKNIGTKGASSEYKLV